MKEREKTRYIKYLSMVNQLEDFRMEGANLYLNGHSANPQEIAREYILNDSGNFASDFYFNSFNEKNREDSSV